jgi:hypothetical protein
MGHLGGVEVFEQRWGVAPARAQLVSDLGDRDPAVAAADVDTAASASLVPRRDAERAEKGRLTVAMRDLRESARASPRKHAAGAGQAIAGTPAFWGWSLMRTDPRT